MQMTLQLLGLMACILLVKHARWHERALQWDLKSQWVQHQGDLSDQVQISEETATDLQWWLLNQDWVTPLSGPTPHPSPPRAHSGD